MSLYNDLSFADDRFTFHTDPGHGWLQVAVKDLAAFGLSEDDFTAYSPVSDGYIYLEEDMDAPKFARAYKLHKHASLPIEELHHNNPFLEGLKR